MDTLKAIQVFICISQQGSLTKAADQLGYSRAMVSRYLEHLENHFSMRLFHRNTRKISLTLMGEKALLHCENIVQQQQLLLELSQDEQQTGMIRLTCGLFILQNGLAECIQLFRLEHPHIQFDVLITEDTVDLIEGQIDLAFRISHKVSDGLIARPLTDIHSLLCAHPDYLKRTTQIQHPDQLLQHACISHQSMQLSSSWTLSSQNQQPQNYPIQLALQSNDAHALYEMCKSALGIAMLPQQLVAEDLQKQQLIQVLTEYQAAPMTLSVVYSSRHHLPTKIQQFIAFVIKQMAFH